MNINKNKLALKESKSFRFGISGKIFGLVFFFSGGFVIFSATLEESIGGKIFTGLLGLYFSLIGLYLFLNSAIEIKIESDYLLLKRFRTYQKLPWQDVIDIKIGPSYPVTPGPWAQIKTSKFLRIYFLSAYWPYRLLQFPDLIEQFKKKTTVLYILFPIFAIKTWQYPTILHKGFIRIGEKR